VYVDDVVKFKAADFRVFFHCPQGLPYRDGISVYYRKSDDTWRVKMMNGTTNASYAYLSAANMVPGWYYIAARWTATELALFVNGVKGTSATNPYRPVSFFASASVGYWSGDDGTAVAYHLSSLIDDLRISSRARTDAEIAAAYQSGQPLPVDQYTTCKLNFDGTLRYKTGEFKVFHNTPDVGYIAWRDLDICYKGLTYSILDGYTNKKFVWWDYDYPYVLQTTDTFPDSMTEDDLLVFLNKNGTAVVVPKSTIIDGDLIVPGSILADHLSANCVTSEKILAGAVLSNHIAADAIGARHIAAGAIASEHIAAGGITADKIVVTDLNVLSSYDGLTRLTGNGLEAYYPSGERILILGRWLASSEILAEETTEAHFGAGTLVNVQPVAYEDGGLALQCQAGPAWSTYQNTRWGDL
jgi:hypothetical protein